MDTVTKLEIFTPEFLKLFAVNKQKWLNTLTPEEIESILNYHYIFLRTSAISKSSFQKGQLGEEKFETLIKNHSSYMIKNLSKIGKRGDFVVEYENEEKTYQILVEIKNYKTSVPKEEMDKFHRDLRANISLDGGIIISYTSKFVGYKQNIITQDFINGIKCIPLLMIVGSDMDLILQSIDMLFGIIKLRNTNNIRIEIIPDKLNKIKEQLNNSSQIRNITDELLFSNMKYVNTIKTYSLELEHSIITSINDIYQHLNISETKICNHSHQAYQYMVNNYKIDTKVSRLLKFLLDMCDQPEEKMNKADESKKTDKVNESKETIIGPFMFSGTTLTININRHKKIIYLRSKIELFIPCDIFKMIEIINRENIPSTKSVRFNQGMFIEITSSTFELVKRLFIIESL